MAPPVGTVSTKQYIFLDKNSNPLWDPINPNEEFASYQ